MRIKFCFNYKIKIKMHSHAIVSNSEGLYALPFTSLKKCYSNCNDLSGFVNIKRINFSKFYFASK